jgi:beta-glucanase (GH16 family)
VAGVGSFNSRINVANWSDSKQTSDNFIVAMGDGYPAPKWLVDANGNGHETWQIRWDLANIGLANSDNSLMLTVPGGQKPSLASCAMIQTNWSDIMYGSVRTVAKSSNVTGTVHAAFFYSTDYSEADIEIQTSNASKVHWTNHGGTAKSNNETTADSYLSDSWTTYHEYRLDWLPGKTMFYIDGVLQKTLNENAPNTAGRWMWNNWL